MRVRSIDTLRDVWDGLRSQPGRIGLAFLALSIGIMSLTILLAVLQGLEGQAQRMIRDLGVNVFAIVPAQAAASEGEEGGRLQARHRRLLAENLPACRVASMRLLSVPAPGSGKALNVAAVGSEFAAVRGWRLCEGRFLDEADIVNRGRNAVVSRDLSRRLDWRTGEVVPLGQDAFRIVGLVELPDSALDEGHAEESSLGLGSQIVAIPESAAVYMDAAAADEVPRVDAIFVRVADPAAFAATVAKSRRLLSQPDQRPGELAWITPQHLVRRLTRLQNTIRVTVGSIAVLCLVLGGTTLMSLMVANVRERVTEIGLRRALGATPGQVGRLFMMEACLVTLAAGLAGTLLTNALLLAARSRMPVPVAVGAVSVFVPLLVGVGLGIVFSYWPARAAAGIAPSEALRNE